MQYQLRIYTVKPGAMERWLSEWSERVHPLRLRAGFEVVGAWRVEEGNRFVWILGYDGPEKWAEIERRYYSSPERAAVDPDPARHLDAVETHLMSSVLPPLGEGRH